MVELFSSAEFLFGAVILSAFQLAKFNEFSSLDETVAERSLLIPNLKARDFTSRVSFRVAAVVFVVVTLAGYLLVCSASPTLLMGWAKVTGAPVDEKVFADSVSYPLYIVAAFMGLTQKGIPGLSKLGDLQRSVFHNWLGVPQKVIEISVNFSDQILAKATTAEALGEQITRLTGYEWRTKISAYADADFYRQQVERLRIDDEAERNEVLKGSTREMRKLIEQLVFAASLATTRKSGGRALGRLANDLGVYLPQSDSPAKAIGVGVLLYLLVLTLLIFLIPMLQPAVISHYPDAKFWPSKLSTSAQFLTSQIFPVLLSTVILLAFWPKSAPRSAQRPEDSVSFFYYLGRYATPLLTVVFTVVLFDYVQALYDYGYFSQGFSGTGADFFLDLLPFNFLHSLVSVSICGVILYCSDTNPETGDRQRSVGTTWLSLIVFVFATAFFYAQSRLHFQFRGMPGADFIVLVVLLNMVAGTMALITATTYLQLRAASKRARSSTRPQTAPTPQPAPPPAPAAPAP